MKTLFTILLVLLSIQVQAQDTVYISPVTAEDMLEYRKHVANNDPWSFNVMQHLDRNVVIGDETTYSEISIDVIMVKTYNKEIAEIIVKEFESHIYVFKKYNDADGKKFWTIKMEALTMYTLKRRF